MPITKVSPSALPVLPLPDTPVARNLTERLYWLCQEGVRWVSGAPRSRNAGCAVSSGSGCPPGAHLTAESRTYLTSFTQQYGNLGDEWWAGPTVVSFNDHHLLAERRWWFQEAIDQAIAEGR